MQATYRGRPLYYWQGDTAPGETNGEGVGNVWYVAQVDGSMPENPPALTLEATTSDLGTFLVGKDGTVEAMHTGYRVAADKTLTGKLDVLLQGKTRADFPSAQ